MKIINMILEDLKFFIIDNLAPLISLPLGIIFGATFMYFCLDWR